MTRLAVACASLVGALLLSGCAADPLALETATELPLEDGGTLLSGVVVDDLIQPLEGAVITVEGEEATTDASGRFRITGLTAGSYRAVAAKEGFLAAELTVELAGGEVVEVQFILVPLASAAAFHETFRRAGFIGCSAASRNPAESFQLAVCGVVQVLGIQGVDEFITDFNDPGMGPDVVGAWGETTWQPNQATSQRMYVIWWVQPEARQPGDIDGGKVNETTGTSPVRVSLTKEQIANANQSDQPQCPEMDCVFIAGHGAAYDETQNPSLVLMVQQRYEDFLTLFHGGRFPSDFSALPDA